MKILHYNIYSPETYTASGKAKSDISALLHELKIPDLYFPSSNQKIRMLQQLKAVFRVPSDCILFVQYPAVKQISLKLLWKLHSKNIVLIAIIHDIPSLRNNTNVSEEIEILNYFSGVISHNEAMSRWFRENGYKGQIENLGIFDYIHSLQIPVYPSVFDASICFAGNLDKSTFLQSISNYQNLHFYLYGITERNNWEKFSNIEYGGCISSDQIPYQIKGCFGLVWDGDSCQTCSGNIGHYLLYNNPHKLSLYIAAEKPVIVWSQSATAPFVLQNQIGIAVDNFEELEFKICSMTIDEYQLLKKNVQSIKKRISYGFYFKNALSGILSSLQYSYTEINNS